MNREEIRKQFEKMDYLPDESEPYNLLRGEVNPDGYWYERTHEAWLIFSESYKTGYQTALASKQEPVQLSMPREIVFGSGKIGVHTEIMSERKAIWLSTLGSGIVDAPTNHPDATSLSPECVLSVMVFNSKESCKVLIEALTDLYHEPAQSKGE